MYPDWKCNEDDQESDYNESDEVPDLPYTSSDDKIYEENYLNTNMDGESLQKERFQICTSIHNFSGNTEKTCPGEDCIDSYFSEAHSLALGRPIFNWTTHVASSIPQQNTPSAKSSVKATNARKLNVKITRRAIDIRVGEVYVQVQGQSDHQVQGQVEEKIYLVSKDHDIVRSARSKNQEILDIIS